MKVDDPTFWFHKLLSAPRAVLTMTALVGVGVAGCKPNPVVVPPGHQESAAAPKNPVKDPVAKDPVASTKNSVASEDAIRWAWVQQRGLDGRQISHAYAPWGAKVQTECWGGLPISPQRPAILCKRVSDQVQLWRRDWPDLALSGDVLVEGDTVFAVFAFEAGCVAYGLALDDGQERWAVTLPDCGDLVQLDIAGGTVYVHDVRGNSYGLAAGTGERRGSSQLPEGMVDVVWAKGTTIGDSQGGRWTIEGDTLRGVRGVDLFSVALPQRPFRTDDETRTSWSLAPHRSGIVVYEEVSVLANSPYSMRWIHLYDGKGQRRGTRRILARNKHPMLWEMHVAPERTLPSQ